MDRGYQRKWTRDDYAKMINLYGENKSLKSIKKKRKPKLMMGSGGGVVREALMISKMLGERKRSRKQKDALIDSLSNSQVNAIGKLFHKFLKSKTHLPKSRIKQLIRDQKLVEAIINGQGKLETRKRILKQRGGILPALLPIAAKIGLPLATGLLGKIFKF